ncbi:MAG: ARPP-1 family domain-containing protein [Desulfomonilaceae bacterium]
MAQIKDFFSEIKVGAKQNHKNMTLYCMLSAHEAPVDFMTLDNALKNDALIITEVTESGSVPELKVNNKSDHKILLLDGEELVGAKQNRVLNTTILIAPNSETIIPVSCVEQGRWSSRAERMLVAPSPTMAMADLYESHKDATEAYLCAFRPVFNQVGIIVFIDGAVAGIEILNKFQSFREIHSKLVSSYVMDALETSNLEIKPNHQSLRAKASKLLESAQLSRIEERKSVALGNDLRLESERLMGSGLEFEEQILQLSILGSDNGNGTSAKTKMRRASTRRENRTRQ